MTKFTRQPLQVKLNKDNYITKIRKLQRLQTATPSATVEAANEISLFASGQGIANDVDGFTLLASGLFVDSNGYKFANEDGAIMGGIYALNQSPTDYIEMRTTGSAGNANTVASVDSLASSAATARLTADSGGNAGGAGEFGLQQSATQTLLYTNNVDALVLRGTLWNGWILDYDNTWTRTGNHTFTISGDVTAAFRKGAKVRYKDGGSYEYGVIGASSYSAPNTTVTLITNTDYAMAAATITNTYISYVENPEGFPHWFNWDANPQGFSAVPTNQIYTWHVSGRAITILYSETTSGTSNATTFTATAPVAGITPMNQPLGTTVDNSVLLTVPGRIQISGTTITFRKDMANAAWTNSGGKRAVGFLTYDF